MFCYVTPHDSEAFGVVGGGSVPTIEVDVSPSVLKWVMQQIGDFGSDNISIDIINKWIDGSKKPTFSQIEKISNYANIPLGYFFLKNPP